MRSARVSWTWPASVLILLTSLGCGRPDPANRPLRPEQVKDFGRLYATHCAGCHGAEGRRGPAPPLNDSLFLAVIPDREVRHAIAMGRAGTMMPAFAHEKGGALTAEQIEIVAAGLRSKWGKLPDTGKDPLPSYLTPPAGTAAAGSKNAGVRVFKEVCATCHGEDGKGDKAGAINEPAFLALMSDQALRRIVITGRPDLGMPDYRSHQRSPSRPLSDQEIADVVALLSSWRGTGVARDERKPETRN